MELSNSFKEEILAPKVRILLSDVTARHKKVESLRAELLLLQQDFKDYVQMLQQKMSDFEQQIIELRESVHSKNSLIVQKKMQCFEKLKQLCDQIKETKEKTLEFLLVHIEFWEKYFSQSMHKANIIEEKSLYTFLDFQNMTTKLFLEQEHLSQLGMQKEELVLLVSKEEHLLAHKEKELGNKIQMIIDQKKRNDINKEDIALFDLEKEIILKEKELLSLQLNLHQKELEFLNSKESVIQEKICLLQEQSQIVRNRLYIDIVDVTSYEEKKIEQQKLYAAKKAELVQLRQIVAAKKLQMQDELDRLRLRFKIKMQSLKQVGEVEYQDQSVSENFAIYTLAKCYANVVTLDRMLYKIKNEIFAQDAKALQSKITSDTVKLLYEICQGRAKNSETFEKERAYYKQTRQSLMHDIKNSKDEIVLFQNNVKDLQRILAHVKIQYEKAKNSAPIGTGSTYKKWSEILILFDQIIKQLEEQHEIMLSHGEMHEQIVITQEESLEFVEMILHEFQLIGVWHRSMSAVTWEGIKNIFPTITLFLKGLWITVMTYFSSITVHKIAFILSGFGVGGIISLLFIFFSLFFVYLLLQASLPTIYKNLLSTGHDSFDPLYKSRQILAVIIGFLIEVFKPLYFWSLCLAYEFLFQVPVALLILFYIYSIIFWIYASRRLLAHVILINRKFDYELLSKRVIERFSFVFSFFAISTIVILVWRKMLMVVMLHQQTELPNILLRLYHVVIFISIVFSLDKEEFLQLLPKKTTLHQKFALVLARYYYFFLIGIFSLLVLSDPYLGGYGSLMWHICWNLFLTACVLGSLFLVHALLKQYTTFLFFSSNEHVGGVTERFEYAKTWYAIYVILLMFLFSMVAVVMCAYVWDYGFTYATVKKIIMYELVKFETINGLGKSTPESFKILNLMYILIMTCIGVFIAYIFKKFVLQRIFDIQYVDPGIQNTVTIISRYVIIITAIMIACIQSKLGFAVAYVSFVLLATFGWSFKDLFTDFVAYFFILVQRPLKLGDYVKIDEETVGVVRKISPRAVILRRKNSVNIVVPNSTVLKSCLYNWNYARNYIGFDDILFSVPFGTDIALVRELCFKVLEEDSDVLKVPQPFVRLQDFGDKGYVFMVRGFLSSGNTLRQWDIASNVRVALVLKLAKFGISIAGPSMQILIKKELNQHNLDL